MRALPGEPARDSMLPPYRKDQRLDASDLHWREAAVLILVYQDAEVLRFPLIVRTDDGGIHGGQISLPGGSREAGESPEACALRETHEELGIGADGIRLLRALSPLRVPPSRFMVRPFVGYAVAPPRFSPSSAEVASLLLPALADLVDPRCRGTKDVFYGGQWWPVPCYHLSGGVVWGATAMILAELVALLAS